MYTLRPKHYEILGSVTEPEKQRNLAELIMNEKLSVREAEVAKEAIVKGLPQEEVIKVVRTIKREKLTHGKAKKVVQETTIKPEVTERTAMLPKEGIVREAERLIEPPSEKAEEPIEETIVCPKCAR